MSATQLKNGLRAWHEELLEFMIANPRASLQETSMFFNVSISWISIVKNSDAFKELWAKRRPEHFSRVSAGVSERLTALTEVTLDALTNKVEQETAAGSISIASLKEVGEMALKSMGFGNKGVPVPFPMAQTNVQNNFFVDRDTLARAREAKAKLQQTLQLQQGGAEPTRTIEHQSNETVQEKKDGATNE